MAPIDKLNQSNVKLAELASKKLTPNEQLALYRKMLRFLECFPRALYSEASLETNQNVVSAAKELLKDVKKATTNDNIPEASVLVDNIETFILLRNPARMPVH